MQGRFCALLSSRRPDRPVVSFAAARGTTIHRTSVRPTATTTTQTTVTTTTASGLPTIFARTSGFTDLEGVHLNVQGRHADHGRGKWFAPYGPCLGLWAAGAAVFLGEAAWPIIPAGQAQPSRRIFDFCNGSLMPSRNFRAIRNSEIPARRPDSTNGSRHSGSADRATYTRGAQKPSGQAGTAVHPSKAATLRNRPEVRLRRNRSSRRTLRTKSN